MATPEETPDVLLNKFLCSRDVVTTTADEASPQQKLKDILNDERWNRRMLEDWLKKGPQSMVFSVTPDPEFRALYLIILSLLEDQGKANTGAGEKIDKSLSTSGLRWKQESVETDAKEEQRRIDERVMEHFDPDATWEQV